MFLFAVFCTNSADMYDLLARYLGIEDVTRAYREYHVLPYYYDDLKSNIHSQGQDTLSICGDICIVSADEHLNYIIIDAILEDNSKFGLTRIGDTIYFSPNKMIMYLNGNTFVCREKTLVSWFTDKYSTDSDFIKYYESQEKHCTGNAAIKAELVGKILKELDY